MNIEWLSPDQEKVWRQWLRAHALLNADLGHKMAPFGLSMQDYAVLVSATDVENDQIRMSELAAELQWDRSRLSHHVKRMENRGLVERFECDEDKRGSYVRPTDQGRQALEAAAPSHVAEVRSLMFTDLSATDLAALDRVTQAIISRTDPAS